MKEIFIGTSNPAKLEFYNTTLQDVDLRILTPSSLPKMITVEEDLQDIVGNSLKKATLFAEVSGLPTISDDTGIFIPSLNNLPGVAVRRWAGELDENISDEDWLDYFFNKIELLEGEDLRCYKHQVITLAKPSGEALQSELVTHGKIIKNQRRGKYIAGGPFSAFFYIDQFQKTEADLNLEERRQHIQPAREIVIKMLRKLEII